MAFALWRNLSCLLKIEPSISTYTPSFLISIWERTALTSYTFRDDPKRNRLVSLKVLLDPQQNRYCPIKLILALALRVGNVTGNSIEEVLAHANRRLDKTIIWSNPNRPVMPGLSNGGIHLVLDKSTTNNYMCAVVELNALENFDPS